MSAAEQYDQLDEHTEEHVPLAAAPDVIEVRRNGGLAAVVGAASSAVAIAWFSRAASTGSLLDWVLVLVTGLLGVVWLATYLDARTPLLVADQQGARMRLGRTWIGLPWSAVASVRHSPRRGLLADGHVEIVAHNPERLVSGLAPAAARQAAWAAKLHGGPLALPLGLGTTVVGTTTDDLGEHLAALAFAGTDVTMRGAVEADASLQDAADDPASDVLAPDELGPDELGIEGAALGESAGRRGLVERLQPWRDRLVEARDGLEERRAARSAERERLREEEQAAQEARDAEASARAEELAEEVAELDVVASPTPDPQREVASAARAEVVSVPRPEILEQYDDEAAEAALAAADDRHLKVIGGSVRPIATEGHAVEAVVLDAPEVQPAADPVIGPELRAARTRLGLSADQVADRTRIRPHVIEAMEVDDFAPCGGDFYARGHLRTLGRVLGIDVAPLLERYDERYAHAPVEARKVFEAELAKGTGGTLRGTRGGPNWSVLVAAVMGMVLVWSVVQLATDSPAEVRNTPVLNGSGGPQGSVPATTPVKVRIAAPKSGAEVVVRDATGAVVHSGSLAIGEHTTVEATAPVRVQSTDGSVTVKIDGRDRGPIGAEGDPAQGTYAGD